MLRKQQELGLDRPLLVRFGEWVSHAVRGDLGRSWTSGQPVTEAITSRLQVTLSLVVGTTLLAALVAIVLGVVAARYGGWADRLVQFLALLGVAIPGFVLTLGLVLLFAVELQLFQPTGYVHFSESPSGWLSSITLPVLSLSVGCIAGVAAQVRGSVIDILNQDFVRTLRSRGLSQRRVVYGHVLRNAAGPALSVLGLQFIGLVGGTVFVEQIFAIPGLGQATIAATGQGDVPLVMGVVLVTAVIVITVNLAVDLVQGWLNPKVRMS